jgi:hypothetical protein
MAIEEAFGGDAECVGGLVVEGINHVPLDVTREVISDCINPVIHDKEFSDRRVAVFATLSRGIASLPIEPQYFELGPLFDLDYLEWRTNMPDSATPQGSFLPVNADRTIHSQLSVANANTEEAIHLARAFVHKRNPAVERTFVRAYQALHAIRSDQKTVTPLHSLFYGWLLPYWRTLGLPKEQVDSEFDGGKVQGAPADGRLTAMFEAEFSNEAEEPAQ